MRIAIFCNDFWPTVGGVQTGVWGLSHALQRRGHVVVVMTRRPPGLATTDLLEGIEVRRFSWNLEPHLTFPLRALRTSLGLRRFMADWRPDVILSHFVSVHAMYAWLCARALRLPLILSFRGNDALHIVNQSILNQIAYRLLTRAAAVNLFCSTWLQEVATRARWFDGVPSLTSVWPDAVEVSHRERVEVPPRPFLLAAGRLVQKKGFDILLRSWAAVHEQIPAELLIAGDGPEEHGLRALAVELGVEHAVRFLGPLPHARLLGVLERSSLCIVPSREEPYGIIVVEAQALGVPVLACSVGNVPHLIQHEATGYLCHASVEGVTTGLLAAWRDPRLSLIGAAGMSTSGAKRTYDVMATELEAWIRLTLPKTVSSR